ncbi:hypothetical protein PG987_009615 [Apiospora arundinis]
MAVLEWRVTDCFLDTVDQAIRRQITLDEFLRRCLAHFGPDGVSHTKDDEPVAMARKCFDEGRWGWLAAAFSLCLADPVAKYTHVEDLMNIFLAISDVGSVAPHDDDGSLTQEMAKDPKHAEVLRSPLFQQAMVATAIFCKRWSVAAALLQGSGPLPRDRNLFRMEGSPLIDNTEDISVIVWAELIKAKWAQPSKALTVIAAQSRSVQAGIAYFEAARVAQPTLATDPTSRLTLPATALQNSDTPDLFKYLCDLLSVPETVTNDMFVLALVERHSGSGGVETLRWMLDKKKLDVNWAYHFDYPMEATGTPGRDRAELEQSFPRCMRERSVTALHAAAIKGNAEAVRFLLERGASPEIRTGLGFTAKRLAEVYKQTKVVDVFQQHAAC